MFAVVSVSHGELGWVSELLRDGGSGGSQPGAPSPDPSVRLMQLGHTVVLRSLGKQALLMVPKHFGPL